MWIIMSIWISISTLTTPSGKERSSTVPLINPEDSLNGAVKEVEEEDLGCLLNLARRGQPHLNR